MMETSSAGRLTVSNTITMVTRPAWGIPAAPILAAVAVTLEIYRIDRITSGFFTLFNFYYMYNITVCIIIISKHILKGAQVVLVL